MDLSNRIFFKLYQCANMLHKTGSRAVETEGLTTQQWAVLGALSRPQAKDGMGVGELAHYLMVSRQNLSEMINRMASAGHVRIGPGRIDRRSRRITMTASGAKLWRQRALPKIHAYYDQALEGFSMHDLTHTLHYLLRMLENMQHIEAAAQDDCAACKDSAG